MSAHPGPEVVMPSTVADAKGLLAAAIADGNPVMYLEHKHLGPSKGPAPAGEHLVPIGKAKVTREGRDVTVVTYSRMAILTLEAAEALAEDRIDEDILACLAYAYSIVANECFMPTYAVQPT